MVAYYLSQDRLLSLLDIQSLPPQVLMALQGQSIPMASAILSNAVGNYIVDAIERKSVCTLQELSIEGRLAPGVQFIYNGHASGKGFSARNRSHDLSLTEKLDEPLAGKVLIVNFSKIGLVNATAYSRLSGSIRIFIYAYVAEVNGAEIRAIPFVIGDLLDRSTGVGLTLKFDRQQEMPITEIEQLRAIDTSWTPSADEFKRMRDIPEETVKRLIVNLLVEPSTPKDWGGEESDLFSANVLIEGKRKTAAFLLKGPARFHQMALSDCGKNGDQIYRLFNIPADVYVIQHCHNIGPAVRKTVEAYALHRAFTAPCRYAFMDGHATARLLRANGEWPAT